MKRRHLFEFNDLDWFPEPFRRMMTDGLSWGIRKFDMYAPIRPHLKRLVEESGATRIIDLCSGAGGPWPSFVSTLPKEVRVTLTDLYPNQSAMQQAASFGLQYETASVDATNVPEGLRGARTIFTGFHHFPPEKARQILEDAVRSGEAIGVFEITERSVRALMISVLTPLAMPLFSLFITPFSLSRIFWTAIIPVIPLANLWDGLVSSLRTYSPDELKTMTKDLTQFHWEMGQASQSGSRVTFLIGWPVKERA